MGIPMPYTKTGWGPQVTHAVEWSILLDLGKDRCSSWLTLARDQTDIWQKLGPVWESISHHPQTMISLHKNDESAPDLTSYSINDKQLSLLPSHLFWNRHALWCLRYIFILYIISFILYQAFTDCILYIIFWYSCEQKYLYEAFLILIFTWFRLVIALESTWSYSANYMRTEDGPSIWSHWPWSWISWYSTHRHNFHLEPLHLNPSFNIL